MHCQSPCQTGIYKADSILAIFLLVSLLAQR
nr:MAG TPA: Nickel-containing superoxide dismutase [Caudoviricetes sp.]